MSNPVLRNVLRLQRDRRNVPPQQNPQTTPGIGSSQVKVIDRIKRALG